GSDATIESTTVRDTTGRASDHHLGRGFGGQPFAADKQRSKITLRRCLIERSEDAGALFAGSDATVESTLVPDTRAQESDQLHGWGMAVQLDVPSMLPGSLDVEGCAIEKSVAVGIGIFGATGTVGSTRVTDVAAEPGSGAFGDGITVITEGANASL